MKRQALEELRAADLRAASMSRELVEHEWWLSARHRIAAGLDEENRHVGGESYFTKPWFRMTRHFTDTGREATYGKDDDAFPWIDELELWQIKVYMDFRSQWELWCKNELERMPDDIGHPCDLTEGEDPWAEHRLKQTEGGK